MRKNWLIGAGLAASLVVAACGSGGGSGGLGGAAPQQLAAAACARGAPRTTTPGLPATSAGLVRPGPVVASLCQYGIGVPPDKLAGMLRQIVLRGTGASGLAALIDSARPAAATSVKCYRPASLLPFVQKIIFGYAVGPSEAVVVAYTECSTGVIAAGGRSSVLSDQSQSDLFYYTDATIKRQGPRMPDLFGLGVQAAMAAAARSHLSLTFDGAVYDGAAPFGTVVFQTLPPGVYDSGPGGQIAILIAVHRAPRCATRQLALSYLGGGPGAGSDFGTLVVRDTSAQACALSGPLKVTGLGQDGHAVTATMTDQVSGVTVLSPDAGPITRRPHDQASLAGVKPDELTGVLPLAAEYRDGPANVDNGLCMPLWRVPATWRIVFPGGHALTVSNADPGSPVKLAPSGGLVTCRGQFGAPQPGYVGLP